MDKRIRAMEIRSEQDIVRVRQAARQLARLLGFGPQDQVRIATSVSEIARNAYKYAVRGRTEFGIAESPPGLMVRISDEGKGIAALPAILSGTYASPTGMGLGIVGAQRLMDEFTVDSGETGTRVVLRKHLPEGTPPPGPEDLARIAEELVRQGLHDPFSELLEQNRELLATLEKLREQQLEMAQVNLELEETNRGVVALYGELDEKSRSLQKASEVRGRFLSNMSHEFRTPVVSILSLSKMLQERADGDLTEEQERQVGYIRKAAETLSDMVNDLLDLSKAEAGKLAARPTKFTVEDLFTTLRGMFRPLVASTPAVSLHFEMPEAMPPLFTDEGKVGQILRNLISNALKYTDEGTVTVSCSCPDDAHIRFAVRDTGIGIAPEHQELVFGEFVQIEGPHQAKAKGTGLGLPLSRKLAELLGGFLWMESRPGAGSTFFVEVVRNYGQPPGPRPAVPIERPILVIDDDEISRYLLRDLLKETGIPILEANRGAEGIASATEQKPRAIFLDLLMPEMSGFEVIEELRHRPETRDIPVIVHTTSTVSPTDRQRLASAAAILNKDAPREVVRQALAQVGIGSRPEERSPS